MRFLKLLEDAFLVAIPLGTTLVMLHIMVMAAQNDWIITLDFNMYGEGKIELSLMLLWVVLYTKSGLNLLFPKKDKVEL